MTKDYDVSGEYEHDEEYCGFEVRRHKSECRSISVPSVSLASLLGDTQTVDLIEMDIEGQELPSLRANIDAVDRQVKRLHIGTHGKEIEGELRRLLSAHSWNCLADLFCIFCERDALGSDQFREWRPKLGQPAAQVASWSVIVLLRELGYNWV